MGDVVCNTTFFISADSEEELLNWLDWEYIPYVKRGGFSPRQLLEIVDNLEPGKKAFALHLHHPDESEAREWMANFGRDKIETFVQGDFDKCVWINTFMRPCEGFVD
ncbi:MAG: DUF4286 family protein [Roseburia sp.]|nr:DUF4286 family protein [Roseburia sp.]